MTFGPWGNIKKTLKIGIQYHYTKSGCRLSRFCMKHEPRTRLKFCFVIKCSDAYVDLEFKKNFFF